MHSYNIVIFIRDIFFCKPHLQVFTIDLYIQY